MGWPIQFNSILGNTVLKMLSQICGKLAYCPQNYFNKKEQRLINLKKKLESINNLWLILGTKVVILVDF